MTDEPTPISSTTGQGINPALIIFLILPIIGLIAAAIIASNRSAAVPPVEPPAVTFVPASLKNNPAPQFALAGPDGRRVKLTELQGRWVFLNFWATWCKPCVVEMPELQKLADGAFGTTADEITVLAVNKGETAEEVRAFLDKYQLTLPVVLDTDSIVSGQYVIVNLPITFIIDPRGIVRQQHIGALDEPAIRRYLELIRDNAFT
jgi:peroxiredoxin